MTHNNKVYDLLYFKGIIEDYNIKLESIQNKKVDDENKDYLCMGMFATKNNPNDIKVNLKDVFEIIPE